MTMFDTHTLHLERLGTQCGSYRLERVLHHDRIRTSYLATGAEEQLFEIQIFEEKLYTSASIHESIDSHIEQLHEKLQTSLQAIYDHGYGQYGEPYLVTQKSDERHLLAGILDQRKVIGLDQSLTIGIQIARILSEMHAKGLFHGCLSPRNIIIEGESVVLGDVSTGYIANLGTKVDVDCVGIPLYMSPERLVGKAASAASDTYALALILYECITGLPPHSSATVTELAIQRRKPPPTLSSATDVAQPPEVEAFFRKALSHKKSDRFPDAQEICDALQSVQRRKPVAPDFNSLKIPYRYNILRHSSPTNMNELQRIDSVLAKTELSLTQRRNKIVKLVFATSAMFALAMYGMTLTCLAGMHQELGAIRESFPDSSTDSATSGDSKNFAINPPKISKDEFSGDTKLDSVLKFCTGYGLHADNTVGNFSKIAHLKDLEYLSITGTAINDADAKSFVALPLKYLDFGNCPNITGVGFQAVQKILSLREMRTEYLPLTPQDLEKINPKLTNLRLKNCNLNDKCVEKLSRLKNLRKLELPANQITRESFPFISSLPELYFLDLQGNPKLTTNDQIKLSKLMPHTVIRFDMATPTNKSLFENISLAKSLKKCKGLDLNAQGTNGDFSEITKFKELQEVDLSRSTAKDHDLEGFSKLPLRYVSVGSCRVTSPALKELQKLPNLLILEAGASNIRDDDLDYLNPSLRELDLSSCHITDRGVDKLVRLQHLVRLSLNNDGQTTQSFAKLRQIKSLRTLDLRDCSNIRTEQAKAFEDSLPDTMVMLNRIRH